MGLSFKKKGETPKIDALLTYQISQSKPQNDPFGSVLGSTKTKNLPGLATVCGPFAHASTRQFHRLPRRKLGKWSTTGFSTWNCWFPGGYSKMVARCWYQPNQRMGFFGKSTRNHGFDRQIYRGFLWIFPSDPTWQMAPTPPEYFLSQPLKVVGGSLFQR